MALIHFLAVVAPGPDFAVTVRQSLVFGRRAGVYTAIGIGAGISVHVLYTLLGFGALIHTIPWLMHAAELLGSAYLLYLGWNFITHTSPTPAVEQTATEPPPHNQQMALRSFSIGFFTNSTNPKATLFFLAVFTTIVSNQTPFFVQAAYGLWMCLVNALWFVAVSLLFTQTSLREKFMKISTLIERLIGVLLIMFALRLLWSLYQGLIA